MRMLLPTPTIIAKRRALALRLLHPRLERDLALRKPIPAVVALDDALAGISDNRIEPGGEAKAGLGNLLGDDGDGGVVVGAAELLVAQDVWAGGHDGAADEGVGVRGPQHGGVDGVFGLEALGPGFGFFLVDAALDVVGEGGGPALGGGEGEVADELLRDGRVPGSVQVGAGAGKGHVDEVAADLEVLDVQRLVDVADKVDDPLEGLLLLVEADGFGDGAGRVVGDGADDAALLWAVALVDDVALLGRGVEGVDVVQGRGEGALGGVAVAVGLVLLDCDMMIIVITLL